MKSNRTNCNLNTCIKKRRVYFKDRFYSKKSRLLAFLVLIKTTFFILYKTFNNKTKLAFQNLCFCKKFCPTSNSSILSVVPPVVRPRPLSQIDM